MERTGRTERMGRKGETMKKLAIWMVAGLVAAWALGAEVPGGIAYQGVLSDPVEGPLAGAQKASFRVFRDPAGGDALWSKDLDVWCAADGAFHAWLEGGDDLIDAFAEPERFLELQVDGHGDAIAPRIAFTSVPQALLARWARQSPLTFAVTGGLSVSNTLAVADGAKFDAGAEFGDLSVEGNAEWQDEGTALEVSGEVSASRFEGDGLAPVGSIMMWMEATNIPKGWMLCDGLNGTPNLMNRFLVGVGGDEKNYAYGQTGGADTVALGVEQIPSHTHQYTTASDRTYHYVSMFGWSGDSWWQNSTSGNHKNGTTDNTGGGKEHENRPPYLAVCFIMRME